MKAFIVSLLILAYLPLFSWIESYEELNLSIKHQEVVIGNQTWMAENLSIITFRNGDTIQEARTIAEWRTAAKEKKPAWCYYNNDSTIGPKNGKIYNFYAVSDPRGLAPIGWKIPEENDWLELTEFLGGREIAGSKIKSTNSWLKNGNGTNSSGFSALPSGSRELAMLNHNDGFGGMGRRCYWWTNTKSKRGEVLVFSTSWKNNTLLPVWDAYSTDGFSIRCIKK